MAQVTRLPSLSMAAKGSGLSPYEDMPVGAMGHFAPYAGLADDFTFYQGPTIAGSAAGLTLGLSGTASFAESLEHIGGAGVLVHTLGAAADAVSLETENPLLELALKQVKGAVVLAPADMVNSDLHFGLGTVGVVHGTADSADMIEVKWDAANAVIEMRTQKDTGGVITTAAPVALSARVAANTGKLHLGFLVTATQIVTVVALDDEAIKWESVAVILRTDASVPTAGDALGMYVASVGIAATTVDMDFWSWTVQR